MLAPGGVDYLLGGKDHFAADRQAAQRLIAALPNAAAFARASRTFLAAAVRHVAGQGIAQYLDISARACRRPRACTSAREQSFPVRRSHTSTMTVTSLVAQTCCACRAPERKLPPRLVGLPPGSSLWNWPNRSLLMGFIASATTHPLIRRPAHNLNLIGRNVRLCAVLARTFPFHSCSVYIDCDLT